MKTWSVYRNRYGHVEVVKNGFNWWAFFFPGIWAFVKGLHFLGMFGIVGFGAIFHIPTEREFLIEPTILALALTYGLRGNHWVKTKLTHDGNEPVGTISAKRIKEAREAAKNTFSTPPTLDCQPSDSDGKA